MTLTQKVHIFVPLIIGDIDLDIYFHDGNSPFKILYITENIENNANAFYRHFRVLLVLDEAKARMILSLRNTES